MRFSLLRSLAFAVLALSAAPVMAEEVTLRVAYDDTELATDVGYAVVTARIEAAADTACAVTDDWVMSFGRAPSCKATLVRKALAELDSRRDTLTAQP